MSLPEDPKGAGAPGAGGASEPDSAIERLLNLFGGGDKPPRLPGPPRDGDDEEEDGMLRMSFLGHLEELRSRLIKCLIGIGVALVGSLCFSSPLWEFVRQPAREALLNNGFRPELTVIDPMEGFNRSEEHTSELQSLRHLVCRLLLEKKKKNKNTMTPQEVGCACGHYTRSAFSA